MNKCDVAIIGAGPYGLSATAYLRTIKGLDVHTFGEPMSFWERNMPTGMLLRSGWAASHLADPDHSLTLDTFKTENSRTFSAPVPLNSFVDYGLWFQQRVVPNLDRRKVVRVAPTSSGFQLALETGDTMTARRVVVAAGIGSFTWRPQQFSALPSSSVSHTCEHRDLRTFSGKKVLVVGSGQSALESAALLHESGAEVEILARATQIRWLGGVVSRTFQHNLGPVVSKILYAPTDVGPAGISQIVARPDLVRKFPRTTQDWLRKRSIRPAGARWLVARLATVPITMDRTVVSASVAGENIAVRLNDGSQRSVDHLLLGTGYRVDVSKFEFFAPELASAIDRFNGYPRLGQGFESSIPGLHFIGAPAVWSFGPLMQFVVGTHYTSGALFRCFSKKPQASRITIAEPIPAEIS